MDVLEVGNPEEAVARADGERTFHRRDVAQYLGSTPIALTGLRLVRGASQSFVRQMDALDSRARAASQAGQAGQWRRMR